MKPTYKYWLPKEDAYLRANHETMRPSEMAKHLKFTEKRVRLRLARLNLKTKGEIEREKVDSKILSMLENGYSRRDVTKAMQVEARRVVRIDYTRKTLAKKFKTVKVDRKMGELLENFTPEREDDNYKFAELSRAEQIIYHSI